MKLLPHLTFWSVFSLQIHNQTHNPLNPHHTTINTAKAITINPLPPKPPHNPHHKPTPQNTSRSTIPTTTSHPHHHQSPIIANQPPPSITPHYQSPITTKPTGLQNDFNDQRPKTHDLHHDLRPMTSTLNSTSTPIWVGDKQNRERKNKAQPRGERMR